MFFDKTVVESIFRKFSNIPYTS